MATKREWESMKLALGPLFDGLSFVYDSGDPNTSWVEFPSSTLRHPALNKLSAAEQQTVWLAQLLYNGASAQFDFGKLMAWADDETWQRCLEAITMRRGLIAEIREGRHLFSVPE